MPLILATSNWGKQMLKTPFGMILKPKSTRLVEQKMAAWLVEQGYATIIGEQEPIEVVIVQNPEVEVLNIEIVEEVATPSLEIWQLQGLDLLNTATNAEIIAAIKGVGPRKVDELINARPLTWESISTLLNERQLEAVKAYGSNLPDGDHGSEEVNS